MPGDPPAWCQYLEEHARRIYQAAFDGDPEPAQRLAERLKASLPSPFKAHNVCENNRGDWRPKKRLTGLFRSSKNTGWFVRKNPHRSAIGRSSYRGISRQPRDFERGCEVNYLAAFLDDVPNPSEIKDTCPEVAVHRCCVFPTMSVA